MADHQGTFQQYINSTRVRRKTQDFTTNFFDGKRQHVTPGNKSGSGAHPRSVSTPSTSLFDRVSKPGQVSSSLRHRVTKRSAVPAPPPRAPRAPRAASAFSPPRRRAPSAAVRPSASYDRPERSRRDYRPPSPVPAPAANINIRGTASGPCVVLGSNFAPGTTAADIEAAFEPVGGPMVNCTLVVTYPAVVAEMVFEERSGAESVVALFNNQKADGRILHVRIKPGPPQMSGSRGESPSGPRDRGYDSRSSKHNDAHIQDGRYGFDDPYYGDRQRLYRSPPPAPRGEAYYAARRDNGGSRYPGRQSSSKFYSDMMVD